MDLPDGLQEIRLEGGAPRRSTPKRKSRSASQRQRKAKRGLADASVTPPAPLPLEVIPAPPPLSDGNATSAGGRSRTWMLANLRRGDHGATVVATSPEATSDDQASTVAAYPIETANADAGERDPAEQKKMKKVKKGSTKRDTSPSTTPGGASASTPSTAQHYVDYDRDDTLASPGDVKRRSHTTTAIVDADDGRAYREASVFDDAAKPPASSPDRRGHHGSGHVTNNSDDEDSQPRKEHALDDSRRESIKVGVEVTAGAGARGTRGRELNEDDARPSGCGALFSKKAPTVDNSGVVTAGMLDFYALPRLMRLQQTFESHRTQLYNFCACHVLEWPTLAVEWIPDRRFADPERDYTLQYVAVGTQAARGHRNTVRVMEVAVPVYLTTGAMYNLLGDDDINGASGASASELEAMIDPGKLFKNIRGHFHTDQVVAVDSTVLKIKAMPAETNTIAVKTASGLIKIYNLVRDLVEGPDGLTTPEATLLGHSVGGFGLSWSSVKPGYIASGSDDGYVNYWDITHQLTAGLDAETLNTAQTRHVPDMMGTEVQPIQRFAGHHDIVTDVSCHHSQGHLIASSSMDGDVRIWDIRSNASSNMTIPEAHGGGATAAQFHPHGDFQIATAGTDGAIGLWDIRHSRREVSSLAYHGNTITGVQWSPFKETVLASHGEDGRVVFWDLAKTTLPMSYSEDAMAPPEVAFVHTGHLGRVTDFSWCNGKDDNWVVASADTMNGVHFYQPRIDVVEDYRVDKQFAGMRR